MLHYPRNSILLHSKKLFILLSVFFAISFSSQAYSFNSCESDTPPQILNKEIALDRLLQCNREIINVKRSIKGNEANLKVAGQIQNPNLTIGIGNLNPKLGIGSGPYTDKTFDTSVRYEQLIERGGKRELRIKSSQELVAASEQDALDIERQQSTTLLKAMVDLAALDERVNLLAEVVALYQETLRANQVRTEKGDLPQIDAERQKFDFNHAQIDLRQAQTDVKAARLDLAILLAWESRTDALHVTPAILNPTPLDPTGFNVTERADVKAAKQRVAAALSIVELARAQQKSDVTAGLQFDHWPTSPSNTTGTGDTISFTVGIPLTINHNFEGEIARATNDYDATKETLERVIANTEAEWVRINADVASAEANLQILQTDQLPRAESVARTVELGYQKGALNLLDLLDARRLLRQTRLDFLAAQANLARAVLTRNQWISTNKN